MNLNLFWLPALFVAFVLLLVNVSAETNDEAFDNVVDFNPETFDEEISKD